MQASAIVSGEREPAECSASPIDEVPVLIIPGWNGSGPGHWQTLWEKKHQNFRRVEQSDWALPSRGEWLARIDAAVESADAPLFLVAHSLGCVAIAHWAVISRNTAARVCGAFLVAPPWLTEQNICAPELAGFVPVPMCSLPFPSLLVVSENDHYLSVEDAERLSSAWGSDLVNIGRKGHINVASGHGLWPAGEALLGSFVERLGEDRGRRGLTVA